MFYAYPAFFTSNDDSILVDFPDIPIHTFGNNIPDAMLMAKDALEMWLSDAEMDNISIPKASNPETLIGKGESNSFVTMVLADTDEYRRQHDNRAVRKNLSIPAWLNYKAEQANAPFSQILQEGLKQYLKIS